MPEPADDAPRAAWELLLERKGRTGMLARCVSCRRPEGLTVLAWRDGWYAVLVPDGRGNRFTMFDPWGRLQLSERAMARIEGTEWKPLTVELDAAGRCPRCAYCEKHGLPLGTAPRATAPTTTRETRR